MMITQDMSILITLRVRYILQPHHVSFRLTSSFEAVIERGTETTEGFADWQKTHILDEIRRPFLVKSEHIEKSGDCHRETTRFRRTAFEGNQWRAAPKSGLKKGGAHCIEGDTASCMYIWLHRRLSARKAAESLTAAARQASFLQFFFVSRILPS